MNFKYYFSRFSKSAKNALHTLGKNIEASTILKQQQSMQIQQAHVHAHYANVLSDIQVELFQAFGGKNYPLLQPLTLHTDIIPCQYKVTNAGVLFYYKMLATKPPVAQIIYQQLKEKLNYDLYAYQQQLLGFVPFNESMLLYPYLLHGLYVMDVSQNGIFITIAVASNYLP